MVPTILPAAASIPVQTVAHAAGVVVAVTPAEPVSSAAELNALEGKLSLYLHTIETRYEADLVSVKADFAKAKTKLEADYASLVSTWNAIKANWVKLTASHVAVGALAVLAAKFLL